jgi:hypothetical protein
MVHEIIKEWEHKGLKCMVVFNQNPIMEWFCGYVGVPKDHPYWGKHYDDVDVDIHGGLTFSEKGDDATIWKNSEIWWFGFDTCHAWDDVYREEWLAEHPDFPLMDRTHLHKWTIDEVISETNKLADLLSEREELKE